jgi:hypothetical protein
MSADEPVRVEIDGGLVTLVLDQPPVNALMLAPPRLC